MVSVHDCLGIIEIKVWFKGGGITSVSKIEEKSDMMARRVLSINFWKKKGQKPSGPGALYGLKDLMEVIISALVIGKRRRE